MFNIFNNDEKDIKVKIMKKFRQFLEEENENIKNKLTKVYCIMNFEIKNKLKEVDLDDRETQFEIKNKLFDIDEMLLYFQDDEQSQESKNDFYKRDFEKKFMEEDAKRDEMNDRKPKMSRRNMTDKELNNEKLNYSKRNEKPIFNEIEYLHKIKEKYVIKFEIILIYYTLSMYLEEIILERTDYFKTDTNEVLEQVKTTFMSIGNLFINIFKIPYHIGKFIHMKIYGTQERTKDKNAKIAKDLFEKMYDLDEIIEMNKKEAEKSKQIETNMTEFLKTNIKTVEIVLNDIVYKIYFPILSKCREMPSIEKKLKTNTENLENYTYKNLNLYKEITVELKENHGVEKSLQLPIMNLFFGDIKIYETISLVIALVVNFLIMISYSKFNPDTDCKIEHDVEPFNHMYDCPSILYSKEKSWQEGILIFNHINFDQQLNYLLQFLE